MKNLSIGDKLISFTSKRKAQVIDILENGRPVIKITDEKGVWAQDIPRHYPGWELEENKKPDGYVWIHEYDHISGIRIIPATFLMNEPTIPNLVLLAKVPWMKGQGL